jgi:hypothetical protein
MRELLLERATVCAQEVEARLAQGPARVDGVALSLEQRMALRSDGGSD